MNAHDRLLAHLELSQEQFRAENGAWIFVTYDPETGDPVNAAGIYESEAEAFLAMREHERQYLRALGEPSWPSWIIPLFTDRKGASDAT